jgi:outer membrane protein assembly factor BamB
MNESQESSQQFEPVATDAYRREERALIFPRWFVIVFGITIFCIAVSQWSVPDDRAMANVLSAFVLMILGFVLYVRFVLFSRASGRVRLGVLIGMPLLAGIGSLLFEITAVSGLMLPTIQLRGTQLADENLEQASTQIELGTVDLRAVNGKLDYPRFLGRTGHPHITNATWTAEPNVGNVSLLWKRDIGAGWSSFAIVNGFAVTCEQRGDEEVVSCYDLNGGALRWAHAVKQRHATLLGGVGPRATPTIAGGRVFSVGATGHFVCLAGESGDVLWEKELLDMIGSTPERERQVIAWGRSTSALAVDGLVVVPLGGAPGGPFYSLVAFDQETGEQRWRSGEVQMSYASPIAMTLSGQRQVVSVNESTVSGHEIETGKVLWEHPWPGSSTNAANNSQVVPVGNDRVWISKGYGTGAALFSVSETDGEWRTVRIWENARVLKTKYTNIVAVDDLAYGLSDGILECVRISTGERVWKKGRFNHGQIMMIDDVIVVQDEDGPLHFLRPHETGFDNLLTVEALDGISWANPAVYDNKLIVRNATSVACYELPITRE